MKNNYLFIAVLSLMVIVALSLSALAAPNSLNVQGKLTTAAGSVLSGTYNFSFKLYEAYTGGTSLYEKNLTISTDSRGIYDAGLTQVNLPFDRQYYLGITINSDSEMQPRINLTSVPYSFAANTSNALNTSQDATINSAINLTKSGNIAASGTIESYIMRALNSLDIGGGFSNGGLTVQSDGTILTQGDILFSGNITILNITTLNINGSLQPSLDNLFDLGNATHRWRNANFSGVVGIATMVANSIRAASINATSLDITGNANITNTLYANAVNVSRNIRAGDLSGCTAIETDSQGNFVCGTDDSGATIDHISNITHFFGNGVNATILTTANATIYLVSQNFNRSISLDPYAKTAQMTAFISNNSDILMNVANITALRVLTINGTDVALFNRSVSLDGYNKSVDLAGYLKSASITSLLSNNSDAILRVVNITSMRTESINGTDISLFNRSISLDGYNKSVDVSLKNQSILLASATEITSKISNNSPALFIYINVSGDLRAHSINGTDVALFNKSVSLDGYNKSVDLAGYLKSASITSLLSNNSDAILRNLNITGDLRTVTLNGTDIVLYNKSIDLTDYTKTATVTTRLTNGTDAILRTLNVTDDLRTTKLNGTDIALYNKSVELSPYAKTTQLTSFLTNNSPAILSYVNVTAFRAESINGTDVALFNKSIDLSAYNKSIDLSSYNKSVDLSSYNKSVELSSYAKSSQLTVFLINGSPALFAFVNISGDLRVQSINGTDIVLYNKSVDVNLKNQSLLKLSQFENDRIFISNNSDALLRNLNITNDLRTTTLNGTDIALFNRSIDLSSYNKSIDLSTYNKSVDLSAYNKSVELSPYAKTTQLTSFLVNNSPAILSYLNVTAFRAESINGTDIALFNRSVDVNLKNQSLLRLSQFENDIGVGKFVLDLGNYSATTLLNLSYIAGKFTFNLSNDINKSIELSTYAKSTQLTPFIINNSDVSLNILNVTSLRALTINGTDISLFNKSISLDSYNKSIDLSSYNKSILLNVEVPKYQSVSGAGNTGNITYWTSGNTVGNSTLYQSLGKIGIGTNNPSKTFSVNGTLAAITIDPDAPSPTINTTGGNRNLTLASEQGSVIIQLG